MTDLGEIASRLWPACASLASNSSKLRSAWSTNQSATPLSGRKSMVKRCDHGIALHDSTVSRRESASATRDSRSKSPESPWWRIRMRPGLASSVSQSDTWPDERVGGQSDPVGGWLPPGRAVAVKGGRAGLVDRVGEAPGHGVQAGRAGSELDAARCRRQVDHRLADARPACDGFNQPSTKRASILGTSVGHR